MKLFLFALALLAMLSLGVNADVLLLTPENGAHSNTNPQAFIFKVTEQPDNCTLAINNDAVKTAQGITANSSSVMFYELLDSQYNWSVSCRMAGNAASSPSYAFTMDTATPVVKLQKPSDNGKVNATNVEFVYLPTDANLKSCSLKVKVKGLWSVLKTNLSTPSGQNNSFSLDLIDDSYDWNIACHDKANNSGTSLFDRKVVLDTIPPNITGYTPFSVITESSATLTVTTNEAATCKYSSSPNASFAAMAPFELTELTTHRQFMSGVQDGINTYYVKCVDLLGNEMPEQKVKLDVHLLATARIALSRPSPLKAGRLDIEVITSRDLIEAPELTYTLDGEAPVSIALTGKGSEWEGTMILPESSQKKLGKFLFTGKDSYGYKGTIITEGKAFIMDTIVPSAIGNLKGELSGGYPMISWHSPDEDISYYEIYRSTKPGAGFADYRFNTTSPSFIDYAIEDRQTYFYRIAAVDQAGNRAALSNEIFITASLNLSSPASPLPKEEPKPLPPNLVLKVNDAIKSIEANTLTVRDAKAQLELLTGETKSIAGDLQLAKKVENSEARLQNAIKNLEQIKASYHSESEVNDAIANANLDVKKAVAKIARNLVIEEQTEFVQDVSKDDVLRAANELSSALGISSENKEDYVEHNLNVLEDVRINTKISIARVEFSDGKSEQFTLFQKSLSYKGESALGDVVVIEFIPKTVAEAVKDIEFISSAPEVIKDDPVLKWGFSELGFDPQPIKYAVNREVSFTDAKETVTVPLTSLGVLAGQTKVTGLVTFPFGKGASLTALLLVATVVLLGFYYFRPASQGSQRSVKDPVSYELLTDINHKLTSMKMEIDDMAHPVMSKIGASIAQNHEVSGLELTQKFVEIASQYLESGRHEKASDLYHAISLLYQQLPKEQKAMVHRQCLELNEKLRRNAK